jgi:transposase
MTTATARDAQGNTTEELLYLVLECGVKRWKVGTTVGLGQKPRAMWIPAGSKAELQLEIAKAKRRFGLSSDARVVSCYEAGRDGFWIHRMLEGIGVENVVVDSSSIEVNRRKRRAKSDQLDLESLLRMLVRYHLGDKKVWKVVRVPSVEVEDLRQPHRELMALKKDRTRQVNRIKGLLACVGVRCGKWSGFGKWLEGGRQWDGTALPAQLVRRLKREYERLVTIRRQICEVVAERRKAIAVVRTDAGVPSTAAEVIAVRARRLIELRGMAEHGGWLYASEIFGWREIRNRRELGALSGLVPTPYQSGESAHEQGISHSGNRYVRALAVELAWIWLRYQPKSELSLWYVRRFGKGGKRMRKVGIVALARKLLIALWRYVDKGILPQGAVLKPADTCM